MLRTGWDEIARLKDQLESHRVFGSSSYSILALHSMVPAADQRRVFSRPPQAVRKVGPPFAPFLPAPAICLLAQIFDHIC